MLGTTRSKREAKLCRLCGEHPALYRVRGRIRYAPDHDLCARCWRSLRDSQLSGGVPAKRLSLVPRPMRPRGIVFWTGLKTGTGGE
jgi:hypothetical protein